MNNQPERSLVEVLGQLTDSRSAKGKRHQLIQVLSVVILGLLCDKNSLRQIAVWASEFDLHTRARLKLRHGKVPSYGTLRRVMNRIAPDELALLLQEWVEEVLATAYPDLAQKLVGVAFDGKTLRHSGDEEAGQPALQMLNVMLLSGTVIS